MGKKLVNFIKSYSNWHRSGEFPDIYLLATPRGGSTWFMEMIWTQAKMKYCSEPFNLRVPEISRDLSMSSFADLFDNSNKHTFSNYLKLIKSNSIGYHNPNPFRKNHSFLTNRIVFKVIHGDLDCIAGIAKELGGIPFVVIRHPIPTALSREVFPLLGGFLRSKFSEKFTPEQLRLASDVLKKGRHIEMGVVAWCLHNKFILERSGEEVFFASYEEAVVSPKVVVNVMADYLQLSDRNSMLTQSDKPSAVRSKSTPERQRLLNSADARFCLINSWRKNVGVEDERRAMDILSVFEIDAYSFGSDLPNSKYRHENSV